MSNLIQTKERLASTKSTQKVIKAMELVASSKIKKAKEKALNNQDFFQSVSKMMNSVYSFDAMQQYLELDTCDDKTLIIGITSDMGLCGAYNANVIKTIQSLVTQYPNHYLTMAGNKGINKLNYENIDIDLAINDFSHILDYDVSKTISDDTICKYHNKEINKVLLVYTKFINPLRQEVEVIDLFGLSKVKEESKYNYDLIVDGDQKEIFNQLLEQYIYSVVYYAVLNSIASEYAARRNSMDAANQNALDMIDELDLEMNRIRQAMITQEIAEIIGGAEALNKE